MKSRQLITLLFSEKKYLKGPGPWKEANHQNLENLLIVNKTPLKVRELPTQPEALLSRNANKIAS